MDLAKQLVNSLHNVLKTCGSVRISFSRRTPQKVGLIRPLAVQIFLTKCLHLISVTIFCRYLISYWKSSVHILRFIFGMVKACSQMRLVAYLDPWVIYVCWSGFDSAGPNPHLGHLAWADAFIITADSISMLSEACSTGWVVMLYAYSAPDFDGDASLSFEYNNFLQEACLCHWSRALQVEVLRFSQPSSWA